MVRGQTVMPGYWQQPEAATAKTMVDGWLWTGDVGHMDAEGYVTMQDRSKDLIISGGTNIYPREVEEALMTHAGVAEVSVVGRPNAEWGEDVVAFVVRAAGYGGVPRRDLDAHCLAQIARFKRPKAYFWLPELPKNNYGKVLEDRIAGTDRGGSDMTDLSGMTALVTGSVQGIGLAVAEVFAAAGARIAVHGLAGDAEIHDVLAAPGKAGRARGGVLSRQPAKR